MKKHKHLCTRKKKSHSESCNLWLFQTRSLACCPVAQCAVIGTASGSVHVIDLSKVDHPRVVHKVHLYHTPVDYLVYVSVRCSTETGFQPPFIFNVCLNVCVQAQLCTNLFKCVKIVFKKCLNDIIDDDSDV